MNIHDKSAKSDCLKNVTGSGVLGTTSKQWKWVLKQQVSNFHRQRQNFRIADANAL